MHLQQTKRESRASGGPQYYFHDLTESIKLYLRKKGMVRVALVTPYGATKSDYFAVSAHHKLDSEKQPTEGKVGHDRIQQGHASKSIGESIRYWYILPPGDFERIDINIEIRDDIFYLTPLMYKYACKKKKTSVPRIDNPLTFTQHYKSPLWVEQIEYSDKKFPGIVKWSLEEICRIVKDHRSKTHSPFVQENDILRASGPLNHLGIKLGALVGKGYDCNSEFFFLDYPSYFVPIELKRKSSGFKYQEKKYGKDELSRAVILCVKHDHVNLPRHIDVIELEALCKHAKLY